MKNLIIDCDPGHDDAIALLLAGQKKYFQVVGVTTEAGNQTIEKTTQNALNLVRFFSLGIRVYPGSGQPIIREPITCPEIHGETGLDGFEFPANYDEPSPTNAVEAIHFLTRKFRNVTIVATGALTNVALALKAFPNIKENIDEIIFMGGSVDNGNVSPAAEFNILCDPEALDIVLKSGVPVKMVGLNVTRKVLVTKEVIERMSKIPGYVSKLFVDLMTVFNQNQAKIFHNYIGGPLHDPVTVASLIDENLVKWQPMNVEVDLSHLSSYGRTNCDVFDYLKKPHNCLVAMDIDVDRFWDIIEEGIKSYGY